MESLALERLLDLARELFRAPDARARAEAVCAAGAELLGRGVTVEVEAEGGAVHAHAGPEMSADLHRARLGAGARPLGELVVDGAGLDAAARSIVRELAATLAAAEENARAEADRRAGLADALVVAAGLASERAAAGVEHVRRRAAVARAIGARVRGADAAWLDGLARDAAVLEVGRAGLPAELLRVHAGASPAEAALVREHLGRGAALLAHYAQLEVAADVARELAGEEAPPTAPLEASIVALAHELALRCGGPAGAPAREAIEAIAAGQAGRRDPRALEALRAAEPELEELVRHPGAPRRRAAA